jgi:AcrR family transcriptional regulator
MHSAVQIFGSRGFASATIAEITDNAGYAKGNFYRYWKSKDDIFLDILADRLRTYRSTRQQGLDKARNANEALDVLVDFLDTIVDDANWSKVFLEFSVYACRKEDLKAKYNTSSYRLSAELFANILSPFVADPAAAKKLGGLVTALFEGFLIQQSLGSEVLNKQDLRQAIHYLARGYL